MEFKKRFLLIAFNQKKLVKIPISTTEGFYHILALHKFKFGKIILIP